jgi:hypothetical protein
MSDENSFAAKNLPAESVRTRNFTCAALIPRCSRFPRPYRRCLPWACLLPALSTLYVSFNIRLWAISQIDPITRCNAVAHPVEGEGGRSSTTCVRAPILTRLLRFTFPLCAATKAADQQTTVDRYGDKVQFDHPFFQAVCMFLGE